MTRPLQPGERARRGIRARLLPKVALSLVSAVLTLAVLEGVFRVLGVHAQFHRPRGDTLLISSAPKDRRRLRSGFFPHALMRSTYDSNPRGYFDGGQGIDHRFNSVGWRDGEHAFEKPAGTYRILGLGDSYLFGQGVKAEDVCLKRLERRLPPPTGQARVETINAGLSGLNTAEQRDILVDAGLRYGPDLVIVHFVPNDVEDSVAASRAGPAVDFRQEYTEIYETPDGLSHYSVLWGWASQRYRRAVVGRSYLRECTAAFREESAKWQRCRAALADIDRICRQREVQLLVVIFPFFVDLNGDYPFQPVHDTVRTFCESQGIDVLDLRERFRGYEGPDLWVHATDQHPNEIAHGIAAEAIARHLEAAR